MKAEERPVLHLGNSPTCYLPSPLLVLAMSLKGNGGSPVMIGRAVNDGDVAAAAEAEEGGRGGSLHHSKTISSCRDGEAGGRDLISESGKGGEGEDKSQFIMNASGRR